MGDFESIFGSDTIDGAEFDTVFGAAEDGELIDMVGQNRLFTESGEEILESSKEDDDDEEDEDDDLEEASMEDIAMENLLSEQNDELLDEAAKFVLVPRFRKNPDLRRFEDVAADAEEVLNYNGEPTDTLLQKIVSVIFRVNDLMVDVASIIFMPSCFFIIGIPYYLFIRLVHYCDQLVQYAMAESTGKRIIESLNDVKRESKDPKVKKECDEQIKKVSAVIKKMKKHSGDYEESVIEVFTAADLETMMECDDFGNSRDSKDECTREGQGSGDADDIEDDVEECGDGCTTADLDKKINEDCPCEDNDFDNDDDEFEDDDFHDTFDDVVPEPHDDYGMQAFNEKPCTSNCESEIDSPQTTADLDRIMADPGNAHPDDLRDLEHDDEDNYSDTSHELYAAESAANFEDLLNFDEADGMYSGDSSDAFDNNINVEGDDDISPDSEGALDDGDDIDSIIG